MAGTGTTFRWREKEAEMQTLQQRLTEREREIGRLKEKLRDLTKKLQQQQQLYNSKVFSRLSMTMTTRFRPVAHSVARRRVPVTQSDYKQKKKRKKSTKIEVEGKRENFIGFQGGGGSSSPRHTRKCLFYEFPPKPFWFGERQVYYLFPSRGLPTVLVFLYVYKRLIFFFVSFLKQKKNNRNRWFNSNRMEQPNGPFYRKVPANWRVFWNLFLKNACSWNATLSSPLR